MRDSCETRKVLSLTSRQGKIGSISYLSANDSVGAAVSLRFTLTYILGTNQYLLMPLHCRHPVPIRLICCSKHYKISVRGTLQYEQYESTTKLLACAFFFLFPLPPCRLAARRKIVCFVGQPMMDRPRGGPLLAQLYFPRIAQAGQDSRMAKEALRPYLSPPAWRISNL